jgi:hypothetical protein
LKTPWGLNATDVTAILTFMAAIEKYNAPENSFDTRAISSMFSAVGLNNGTYTPPLGLNLTLASLIIEKNTSAVTFTASNFIPLGHDWEETIPSLGGDFGENYIFRAYTAYSGYLQLVAKQVGRSLKTSSESTHRNSKGCLLT